MLINNLLQKIVILISCMVLGMHSYAQSKLIKTDKADLNSGKIYDENGFTVKSEKSAEAIVPQKFADNGMAVENSKAVDLGLSSGTKWVVWNIGGSEPEDYGGYYAWGSLFLKILKGSLSDYG